MQEIKSIISWIKLERKEIYEITEMYSFFLICYNGTGFDVSNPKRVRLVI